MDNYVLRNPDSGAAVVLTAEPQDLDTVLHTAIKAETSAAGVLVSEFDAPQWGEIIDIQAVVNGEAGYTVNYELQKAVCYEL